MRKTRPSLTAAGIAIELAVESQTPGECTCLDPYFLLERGFHQVTNFSTDELNQIYLSGKMADRQVAGGYGIAIGQT